MAFLVTGFEAGMMGYSLYTLLFGAENLSVMAMAALGGDVFVFTLYMAMLKSRDGMPAKQIARETLLSPIFLAILAGVLLGATGLWRAMSGHFIGAAVAAVGDFLSGPTACAILFVVGYNIEFSRDSLVGAVRAAGVRLLFCAAFCVVCILFLTWTVGMTDLLRWALILLFTLPGALCAAGVCPRRGRRTLCVFLPFALHAFVGGDVLRHRRSGRLTKANISLIFTEGAPRRFLFFVLWYNGNKRLPREGEPWPNSGYTPTINPRAISRRPSPR